MIHVDRVSRCRDRWWSRERDWSQLRTRELSSDTNWIISFSTHPVALSLLHRSLSSSLPLLLTFLPSFFLSIVLLHLLPSLYLLLLSFSCLLLFHFVLFLPIFSFIRFLLLFPLSPLFLSLSFRLHLFHWILT